MSHRPRILSLVLPLFFTTVLLQGCAVSDYATRQSGYGALIGGSIGSAIAVVLGEKTGKDRQSMAILGGVAGAMAGSTGGAVVYRSAVASTPPERAIRKPVLESDLLTEQRKIDALHDSIKAETKWKPDYPRTVTVRGVEEEDRYAGPSF